MAYDSNWEWVYSMRGRSFDRIISRYKKSWIPEDLYKTIDLLLLSRHKARSVKKKNMHYVLNYYMLNGETALQSWLNYVLCRCIFMSFLTKMIKWNRIAAGLVLPCQESTLPCQENSVDLVR